MLSITKLVTVILLVLASPSLNPLNEDFSGLVTSFHQDEQHVCSIYIYTDPFLWRQVYKMEGKWVNIFKDSAHCGKSQLFVQKLNIAQFEFSRQNQLFKNSKYETIVGKYWIFEQETEFFRSVDIP